MLDHAIFDKSARAPDDAATLSDTGYGLYTSYQYPGGLNLNLIAPPPPPPM